VGVFEHLHLWYVILTKTLPVLKMEPFNFYGPMGWMFFYEPKRLEQAEEDDGSGECRAKII
jgi:hypothetical protein